MDYYNRSKCAFTYRKEYQVIYKWPTLLEASIVRMKNMLCGLKKLGNETKKSIAGERVDIIKIINGNPPPWCTYYR